MNQVHPLNHFYIPLHVLGFDISSTQPQRGFQRSPHVVLEDEAAGGDLAHHALALCKGRRGEAEAQQGLWAKMGGDGESQVIKYMKGFLYMMIKHIGDQLIVTKKSPKMILF